MREQGPLVGDDGRSGTITHRGLPLGVSGALHGGHAWRRRRAGRTEGQDPTTPVGGTTGTGRPPPSSLARDVLPARVVLSRLSFEATGPRARVSRVRGFCVHREENHGTSESERDVESLHDGEVEDRATSSVASRRAVLKRLRDEEIEHILFWFTDLEGHLEVLRRDAVRDGGGARRRDGLRRLVHHGLQRDRGVGHGCDSRSRHVPGDAQADRRARTRDRGEGRAPDLRRRQARRHSVRRRPSLRAARRARPDAARLRRVQRRPGARVLPLRGRQRHEDARRGRLLRDDGAGRGDRGSQRHDPRARRSGSRSSTTTTRSRRRSTRSTCATRTRSRWPTTRSPTG